MKYIAGTSRDQLNLFETKLDDIITEDNPVRFIDAFVDKLNLLKIGFKVPKCKTGRPPYAPSLLLKIYIYGYLNRLRSSRKLERECCRNNEMIWLTKALSPDFKTIADFRKENRDGIKNLFKEFLKLCHKLDLIAFKCTAIDGTKERSQNGSNNVFAKKEMLEIEKKINEKIDNYLKELEQNDEIEQDDYQFLSSNITEKIKKLKSKKGKIDVIKKIFEENPALEKYYANDPDCKFQNDNGKLKPGYNCQTAVDEKNNLIIVNDVTNENNDMHQLNNIKEKITDIKNELEVDDRTIIVTDSGYYDEREIFEANNDESCEIYVPHPRDVKTKEKRGKEKKNKIPAQEFTKDNFKYDIEKDIFICPEGKTLNRVWNGFKKKGLKKYTYQCKECNNCDKKPFCSKSKNGRTITASENIKEMIAFRDKCNSTLGKRIIAKRKAIVEHPFGTIKRNWGYTYFMQKGLENVQSEFSFITFTYNLRRVLNLIPIKKLLESI